VPLLTNRVGALKVVFPYFFSLGQWEGAVASPPPGYATDYFSVEWFLLEMSRASFYCSTPALHCKGPARTLHCAAKSCKGLHCKI